MILTPFNIIVLQILLVQITNSANWYSPFGHYSPLIGHTQQNAFSQSKVNVLRNPVSNKDDVYNNALLIEDIYNHHLITPRTQPDVKNTNLGEIKTMLNQLINKVDLLGKRGTTKSKKLRSSMKNKQNSKRSIPKRWGKWADWSACSVSCGKGREIKWRHCLKNCNGLETEMREKSCQLPACGGKLFGLINL